MSTLAPSQPPSIHHDERLDPLRAKVQSGQRLTLEDGTLAGADIDFPGVVRVLVRELGVALPAALRMATVAPARALGAEGRLGRLAPELPADMVHLDDDLALKGVWRAGGPLV